MKLNDIQCKSAKPKDKAYKLFDGGGLFLEVTPKNSKLWRLKYRFLNKEKKLSIGPYPLVTLAEARMHRDAAKKLILEGKDPSSLKRTSKRERIEEKGNTFEVIGREWHDYKKAEWSQVNAEIVLNRMQKDIFPVIGHYPIKEITHPMILDMANDVKKRGAKVLPKRLVQICKNIFQYAIITERAEHNIALNLRGYGFPLDQR